MAKAILISYAGYPYTPSSFMPDNGLANLAAALKSSGHSALILDYGTPDLIRRLVPKDVSHKLAQVYDRSIGLSKETITAKFKRLYYLLRLTRLDSFLNNFQQKAVDSIAAEISDVIKEERPDFIGLKLWNGDGFTGSIAIASRIKKDFPNLPVFAGGPHAELFRQEIFKATDRFDCLLYSEGERTIVELAEYVEGKRNLSQISNLIYKENGGLITTPIKRIEKLDELPLPIYDEDVYPAMKNDNKIKMIVLDESRGCPHRCYFCWHPEKSGNLRLKTAERVVNEMKYIQTRYDIRSFRYAGSATPGKLMREIAEKILEEGIKVEYTSFAHIRGAHPEGFRLMKRSGLFGLFFGIESGSQEILDKAMNKRVKVDQIREVIQMAKEAGIFTAASMIIPAPFDTPKTIKESLDLLLELRPDSVPVQFAGLLPLTEWTRDPERFGFELNKETYCQEVMNYKIKLLFPPRFWKPLPYRINGMRYRKFSQTTEQFIKALEAQGIMTGLSDDLGFIAKYSGMDLGEFRDKTRKWLFCGDYERIQEMVGYVNENTRLH